MGKPNRGLAGESGLRRLGLAGIAAVVLGVSLLSMWQGEPGMLSAQTSPYSPPQPTPTPLPSGRTRVVNEITHPQAGDAIAGIVEIKGTALIDSFQRYDVHLALAGTDNWQWLYSSQDVVRDGILHRLDSSGHADGFYDLRVRAVRESGNYSETFLRNIEFRNANPPTPTPAFNELGTPQPASYLPTPTITPTPTPGERVRIEGGQGFYSPEAGATISGYVPIVGTVNGSRAKPFARYELALSVAGKEQWTWLYSGSDQVWQEEVYLLDTLSLADGPYDLRLRIVYRDGNYDEYHLRNLRVANQGGAAAGTDPSPSDLPPANGFRSPQPGTTVRGVTDFVGTAVGPGFQRWELYWSPAGQESWAFLVSDERPVLDGVLARLDLGALPPASYDFRLRVVYADRNYTEHYLRNVYVEVPLTPVYATPAATPTD